MEGECPIPMMRLLLLSLRHNFDDRRICVCAQQPKILAAVSIVQFLRHGGHLPRFLAIQGRHLLVFNIRLNVSMQQVLVVAVCFDINRTAGFPR